MKIFLKMKRAHLFAVAFVAALLFSGCSEKDSPEISVTPPVIETGCAQASFPVEVSANKLWTAQITFVPALGSTETPWCVLSKSNGNGSQNVNLIVDELHTVSANRKAVITFTTQGELPAMATILVTQHGETTWE